MTENVTYPAQPWDDEDLVGTPAPNVHITYEDFGADNTARAGFAARALARFGEIVAPGGEEPETLLTDLIADLMHFADAAGLDFGECAMRGERHYACELTGDVF